MDDRSSSAALATEDREITAVREFDAPRELVWKAWSDSEHTSKWWGPVGFTTTTDKFDFRPGGVWHHTMHGPDGTDYWNEITYTSIVENELIEYEHGPEHPFRTTAIFEDAGVGRTRITWRMLFPTVEQKELVIGKYNAERGLKETIDRLGQYVTELDK